MQRTFNFRKVVTEEERLDVEDVFNVAIRATDSDGCTRCLVVMTEMGMSTVLSFGPIMEGSLCDEYTVSYFRTVPTPARITGAIHKFLQGGKGADIIEAEVVDPVDALADGIDVVSEVMKAEMERSRLDEKVP